MARNIENGCLRVLTVDSQPARQRRARRNQRCFSAPCVSAINLPGLAMPLSSLPSPPLPAHCAPRRNRDPPPPSPALVRKRLGVVRAPAETRSCPPGCLPKLHTHSQSRSPLHRCAPAGQTRWAYALCLCGSLPCAVQTNSALSLRPLCPAPPDPWSDG